MIAVISEASNEDIVRIYVVGIGYGDGVLRGLLKFNILTGLKGIAGDGSRKSPPDICFARGFEATVLIKAGLLGVTGTEMLVLRRYQLGGAEDVMDEQRTRCEASPIPASRRSGSVRPHVRAPEDLNRGCEW